MPPRPKRKTGRPGEQDDGTPSAGGGRPTLSQRPALKPQISRRGSFEEEGVLHTVSVVERQASSKQSKLDKVRAVRRFVASQDHKALLPSFAAKKKSTNEESSNISTSGRHFSDSNSIDSDHKISEEGDTFEEISVPQAPRRAQPLARSLIGELKLTPSMRQLAVQGSEDDENHEAKDKAEMQYTISKKKIRPYGFMTYPIAVVARCLGLNLGRRLQQNVDSHLYKPSKLLYRYISWTFYSSFLNVFFSFLFIFVVMCLIFGGFLLDAGNKAPECIVVSGEEFGTNPDTKFYDAFALSWTTFTTVGYGNIYTATGTDFDSISHGRCSWVVFLCTLEAFVGLLYAGMCAAILFGKVNRVQCHANVEFSNAVCLLYQLEKKSYSVDEKASDTGKDIEEFGFINRGLMTMKQTANPSAARCPVLKFQVVNEYCNKEGGDIIDAFMKVIGVKTKTQGDKITHSQIVRVHLVDSEHPFFSRIWHGVHVLDGTSQLLTQDARDKIKENGGVWPKQWFEDPEIIRNKLDFHSLILTISGTSNLSACTVHAYKRYSSGDLLVGFDFAPLVFFNDDINALEVDMSLVHDVKEQSYGAGEDVKSTRAARPSTLLTESFRRDNR